MTGPEPMADSDESIDPPDGGDTGDPPVCAMDPREIASRSFTLGPQRVYVLTHIATGATASARAQDGEPLTPLLRADLIRRLAVEVLGRSMTEAQWLGCPDPRPMLLYLKGKATRRKLRLFACAMSRRSLHLLAGLDGPALLRQAEDATDAGGDATTVRLPIEFLQEYAARHSINARGREAQRGEVEACHLLQRCLDPVHPVSQTEWEAAWHNAMFARQPFEWTDPHAREGGQAEQVAAIRDIFGNPFRSAAFDPAWLTPSMAAQARGVYEGRAFDRLPILADALEEAGCDNGELLAHCRGDGPHVRGCWAVDLMLGRD